MKVISFRIELESKVILEKLDMWLYKRNIPKKRIFELGLKVYQRIARIQDDEIINYTLKNLPDLLNQLLEDHLVKIIDEQQKVE